MNSKIPEDYIDVLETIHDRTKEGPDWILSGSTNPALHGMNIEPTDIDILTNEEGTYDFQNKFGKFVKGRVEYREINNRKGDISFYQLILKINDIDVEVLGDFRVDEESLHQDFERDLVDIGSAKIPTIPLEKEYWGYLKTGRYKKASKVKEILSEESN